MSNSAKHRAAALSETERLAALIVTDLAESSWKTVEEQRAVLVGRLYPMVRSAQKREHAVQQAQGIVTTRDRHVRHLVAVIANLHEQLEHCVEERDRIRAARPLHFPLLTHGEMEELFIAEVNKRLDSSKRIPVDFAEVSAFPLTAPLAQETP